MLDNSETFDGEFLLPAMMMAYNSHVHRAIGESPFFPTYLHLPKLPFFNLDKPRPLYGESYVEDAFRTMTMSYNAARDNLKEAEKIREEYFNRKTEKQSFAVGDKVLVKFPKIPRGVNPNIFKKWRGGFIAMKKVGELNLVVCASPHSKPILVHVD